MYRNSTKPVTNGQMPWQMKKKWENFEISETEDGMYGNANSKKDWQTAARMKVERADLDFDNINDASWNFSWRRIRLICLVQKVFSLECINRNEPVQRC